MIIYIADDKISTRKFLEMIKKIQVLWDTESTCINQYLFILQQ